MERVRSGNKKPRVPGVARLAAFLFSTTHITFAGEITPQAYFSRDAMCMGSLLAPLLLFYQLLLYPVAKPGALVLDRWLDEEDIGYFKERDLHTVIRKHIEADKSDVSRLEGIGTMKFWQWMISLLPRRGNLSIRVVVFGAGFQVAATRDFESM